MSTEIEGFRVTFQAGVGWQCQCAEFAKDRECRHTIMAAASQTLKRNAPIQ